MQLADEMPVAPEVMIPEKVYQMRLSMPAEVEVWLRENVRMLGATTVNCLLEEEVRAEDGRLRVKAGNVMFHTGPTKGAIA